MQYAQGTVREQLLQGLAALSVSETALDRTVEWLDLLEHWNRVFNLTAIPAAQRPAQFVFTSAAAIPYLRGGRVADVGSGGGVPGIPLALLASGNQYALIDSNHKKIRFLDQCCRRLKLNNVQTLCVRVQAVVGCYDTIISRAFAQLDMFLSATRHLGHQKTHWLLFKHNEAQAEAEISASSGMQCTLHRLQVPSLPQPVFLVQAQL